MASLVTGPPQSDRQKLIRLGIELRIRGATVGEHPAFGGVAPGVHAPWNPPKSYGKHPIARAIDVNRSWKYNDPVEQHWNDRVGKELMQRGFGVISNRRNYAGDHTNHLHVETITSRSENYKGRMKLHHPPIWTANLKVDGKRGPKTITALQISMGMPVVDGKMDWGGRLAKALQAFLNTELNAGLVLDGKAGKRTQQALSRYFGFGVTNHNYITQGQWRVIQERLNANGNIATPV